MSIDIAEYAVRFKFRTRRAHEPLEAYRAALVDHIRRRDFAAAHEVRVNKPQAAWSPEDVAAFRAILESEPPARTEFSEPHLVAGLSSGPHTVSLENLRELADAGLAAFRQRLEALGGAPGDSSTPTQPLVGVLLTTGEMLTTVAARGDRVATVKALAREQPVFGFFVVTDALMHAIDEKTGQATRRDCLIVNIGTREVRILRRQMYRFTDRGIEFEAPVDLDLRSDAVAVNDPYASIFVSVPEPTGRPS